MIISQSRAFIFVHIPRCAGTSITQALSSLTTWQDIELGGTRSGEAINREFRARFGLHKHSRASDIRKVVGEAFWSQAYKFAVQRNEDDRRWSAYRYIKQKRTYSDDLPVTYDEFLKWPPYLKGLGPDRMFSPQSYWLDEKLDFVVRMDKLDKDFSIVAAQIGAPSLTLGRHNATKGVADTLAAPR